MALGGGACLLLLLAAGILLVPPPGRVVAAESASHLLVPARQPGETHQVKALLEVQGELRWKPEKQEQPATSPLQARGELVFDERLIEWDEDGESRRSVRHYRQAEAQLQIGRQTTERKLPPEHRLMINQVQHGQVQIRCLTQPLTRDELDLVDIHGNTLALHFVLPGTPVSIGDRWDVPEHALRALLGLDVVTENSVTATLRSVADQVALVDLAGHLAGEVGGAKTSIQLQAKCNFHLEQRDIRWFTAVIQEEREISDTQPGFQVTARLRVALQPTPVPSSLDDSLLETLPPEIRSQPTMLRYVSSVGHFEMLLDPGWRTIIERTDVTVIRLFERGQLVAQLLASPLPDGPSDKQLTAKSFEAEVLAGVAPHAGQIVETAEGTSDDGLRVIRVTAVGVISEISMQWVYYHISEPSGRRLALAFTVQTDLLEDFAERDRAMVETFRFLPRDGEAEPQVPAASETPAASSPRAEALPTARPRKSAVTR